MSEFGMNLHLLQNFVYAHSGGSGFKIFIWGGISSDIRSEILFYGAVAVKLISNCISDDIPPQMKILKTVVP